MFKLIVLFSLILPVFALSQIKKEFDLQVEITAKEIEEKPKLYPPHTLSMEEVDRPLDLSSKLLEPPKEKEVFPVYRMMDSGLSCGKPADAVYYKKGVDYYMEGKYGSAVQELEKILTMPSNYKPMAEYILGLIYLSWGQKDRAFSLFKNSCGQSHRYKEVSCELFYALSFELNGNIPENQNKLWSVVYGIKKGKEYKAPDCQEVVFKKYCAYVKDFLKGDINESYKESTSVRKAIVLFEKGQLEQAEEILIEQSKPKKTYRDIALYYLGLTRLQKNDTDGAYRYASILETLNREYAHSLYSKIASKGMLLSRVTYTLTKEQRFLEMAGIMAYNNKDYHLAFSNFLEAKNLRYAIYSLINMGDYAKAYKIIKMKKDKDEEDYKWLLESAYWSGLPIEEVLESIKGKYPDLYKEYSGWNLFRKGDWSSAIHYFDDTYHRALCYYNLKKYGEVIKILQDVTHQRANILKAKSALFLNKPSLARSFLSGNSEEELYLLGLSYFMEGDYDRSIQYFSKIPKDSSFGPKALMKIGDSLYNLGKEKEAKDTYWEILKTFPDHPVASQATLAILEIGDESLTNAQKENLIKQYLKKNPDSPYAPELNYQLADLLIRRGETKEAERILVELYEKETSVKYKALLRLASIEKDRNNKAVLLYKVYKEGTPEESAQARKELINLYSELGDMLSFAELLKAGDFQEKEKAMEAYVNLKEWNKAMSLAKELMQVGYRSQSFERSIMEIYQKTKDQNLLDYLIKSPDVDVSAKAKLEKALILDKDGKPKEALEYLVDISINNKGASVYNLAIVEGAQIFLNLGLKNDASCFLDRADLNSASSTEKVKIENLKRTLPECEVR